MDDGAEGSMEAAQWRWRLRAWRSWWAPTVEAAMEDGGIAAVVEKGAAIVDPEKGAATVVEEVGGHVLVSSHLTSSLSASSCHRR
jgi:hypothetical protein